MVICSESCFLGNRQPIVSIRVLGGSRVPAQIRGLKTTWSGKLSDSCRLSTTEVEEGIVGASNQAVNR